MEFEQLDLFSFLDTPKPFSPLEEYAKRGSGFQNGKKRIYEFFKSNASISKRAEFLKNEYGIGGFGTPVKAPNTVHAGYHDAKGARIEYFDNEMEDCTLKVTYKEIAVAIDKLINEGTYIQNTF